MPRRNKQKLSCQEGITRDSLEHSKSKPNMAVKLWVFSVVMTCRYLFYTESWWTECFISNNC